MVKKEGYRFGVALVTGNLASLLAAGEDQDKAYETARRAVALCTEEKAYGARAVYRLTLADLELERGNIRQARDLTEESLKHLRQYGQSHYVTWGLTSAGRVAIQQAEYDTARAYLAESLQILEEYSEDEAMIQALEAVGELLMALEQWQEAAVLYGAASSLREEVLLVRLPLPKRQFEEQMRNMREHVSRDELQAAWDQGQGLDWEAAIALAKKLLDTRT